MAINVLMVRPGINAAALKVVYVFPRDADAIVAYAIIVIYEYLRATTGKCYRVTIT